MVSVVTVMLEEVGMSDSAAENGAERDHSVDLEPGVNPEPGAGADQPPVFPAFEVPDPPQTGDVDVDTAINAVAAAMDGPLEEQLAVYEAAHRTLQERLADVEG